MAKIGIGMIGCGGRLRGVVRRLMQQTDQVRIVGLYDPSDESIERTRKQFEVDAPAYSSVGELCALDEVDWIMIGSWNCFHREQAVAAFEAGKHVFCEKPLATTIDDCIAMRDAWRASGKLFSIGFTLRYSPHYRRIRELLDEGAIGKIISMEFNETLGFNHGGYIHGDWRRLREYAGTHLLEKCCHDVDLVNWMVESKAARVASFGGLDIFKKENAHFQDRVGPSPEGKLAYQTWPGKVNLNPFTSDKDIIDNQVAIVEFENGIRTTFHTNCSAGIPERRMYICGTEGAIRSDVIAGQIQLQRIGFGAGIEDAGTEAHGGHGGGDMVLAESLAKSMLDGAQPFTGLEDGLKSAVTCFAIDDAMDSGQVVDVNPYWEKAGL